MVVDLSVPVSWETLTQEQLRYACFLLSSGSYSQEQIAALTLIRWGRVLEQKVYLSPEQLAGFLPVMGWLFDLPGRPLQLAKVQGRAAAVRPDLQGLPFGDYLRIGNHYQGYVHTKDLNQLLPAVRLLYDDQQLCPDTAELFSVFLWLASANHLLAIRFPHFFVASPVSGEEQATVTYDRLRRAMNMQIRALTGGDITKEKEVLEMDTWRALTELDAKAEEYEELKKMQQTHVK